MNSPRPSADRRAAEFMRKLILVTITIVLGLLTKVYVGPFGEPIRDNAGGFFYVVFFILAISILCPRIGSLRLAAIVFVATCGVEFLQLWELPILEAARESKIGQLLLGSTFSWRDFPPYLIGGIAGYFLLNWIWETGSTKTNGHIE